ncbi:hypothetical protein SLS60_011645 [Paraconiothyrium brasiliense]|uniref:BTB domain-containing protein n=1 Tax=Paraconiothyrium brasiliense TaxID=300254 RepID=A0ABR3QHL4_9PLEO
MASSSKDSSTSSDSSNTSDSEESSSASAPRAPNTAPSTRPKDPPRARPRISYAGHPHLQCMDLIANLLYSGVNQSFATVVVGTEEATFVVHEALLTHYSEFFRAALQGGFQEAKTKTVTLKDDSSSTFELFVHWLYHERLPNARKDDAQVVQLFSIQGDKPVEPSKAEAKEHLCKSKRLVHLYVFGNTYQAAQFKTATLRSLFKHLHKVGGIFPRRSTIAYAFTKLPNNDPLCRLLVDFYCLNEDTFSGQGTDHNANFLYEVTKRWYRLAYGDPDMDIYEYQLSLSDYLDN